MSKEEEHQLLQKISSQLEGVTSNVSCLPGILEKTSSLARTTQDHEMRIKNVEKSRIPLTAGAAVVGGVLSHFLRLLF